MNEISTWLNSPQNYTEGTLLYDRYGTNNFLKKRFKVGPDAYNKQKLLEELQKLATKPVINPEATTQSPTAFHTNSEEDQAKYLALLRQRDDTIRQIDRNMAILDISNSKNVLHETAKQILRLHQRKTEIWAQIDFYQENGVFEPPPPAKKEKTVKQEIQLLYQAISKANKRLKNPDYNNKKRTEALKTKHLERLSELKSKL